MLYRLIYSSGIHICTHFFLLIRYYTNIHILILYTRLSKYHFFDDLPVTMFNRQSVYFRLIFLRVITIILLNLKRK